MMRGITLAGGAALMLGLGAVAAAQVAADTTRTVQFTITYKAGGPATAATTPILHVLKGQCVVQAGAPQAWGIDGPTAAQERAMKKAPAAPTMASMEAEAKKCGKDQGCLMALASRMMEDGSMDRAMSEAQGGGGTEPNFQIWNPQSCSGTLTVTDRTTRSGTDSMANTQFSETRTLNGTATIANQGQRGWLGLYVQHDLKKNATELRFIPPSDTRVDGTLVRTGYGAKSSSGKEEVLAFPNVAAPSMPGGLQAGRTVAPTQGGSVTFEWTVAAK
jgi:hypothetical protein